MYYIEVHNDALNAQEVKEGENKNYCMPLAVARTPIHFSENWHFKGKRVFFLVFCIICILMYPKSPSA